MALLTFLSDFGEKDHYVAAVKAAILRKFPSQPILDISHHIRPNDIGHAAYVIRQVFSSFPEGTVHLVAVDPVMRGASDPVAVKLGNHFFVGHDSGIHHLIRPEPVQAAVTLPSADNTFPARDILAPAAAQLANGTPLEELGSPRSELQIRIDRQLKATKKEIVGQVVHIDVYGNLVTNINRRDFDAICKIHGGNPPYTVRFAREQFQRLHTTYSDVEGGECFVLFNAYGLLEIGINKGRACDLMGLRLDTPVIIEFNI